MGNIKIFAIYTQKPVPYILAVGNIWYLNNTVNFKIGFTFLSKHVFNIHWSVLNVPVPTRDNFMLVERYIY